MTVIPPGFAECSIRMRHSADPDPWYVVHGIQLDPGAVDLVSIAVSVGNAFLAAWGDGLTSAVTVEAVEMRVGQDGGEPLFVEGPLNTNGNGSSGRLPQNCALLVSKSTGRGGRRGRGRAFIPNVLPESEVSDTGVIAPASVSREQGNANLWLAELSDPALPSPVPMVLLHSESTDPTAVEPDLVTALTVSPLISTQRRRLR